MLRAGNLSQNRIDAVGESHIQHFVRFVHNHVPDRTQIDCLTVHQVEQASRCRYHYMYATFQRLDLTFNAGTSVYRSTFRLSIYLE